MKSPIVAAACLALSLLTYFQFPGHAWLQQDSQIFAPILEHLRDPALFRNEILAAKPHVAYTLYDETARALRGATGLDFQAVLALEQIAARALGIWGLYLMALTMCRAGLWSGAGAVGDKRKWDELLALFIAAICSLGANIAGPAVLTFEYEPTPRAFALPLALCASGLLAHGRRTAAGIALAAAFLYHPPTALPFWAFFCVVALWPSKSETRRSQLRALAPLALAVAVLALAARLQQGGGDALILFARLTPELERLQRLRSEYTWISLDTFWSWAVIARHLLLFGVVVAAFIRLRRSVGFELRLLLLGLPALGILSMPVSWLLLDRMHWAFLPQIQPMRYLLFGTLFAQLLCAAAGVRAAAGIRAISGAPVARAATPAGPRVVSAFGKSARQPTLQAWRLAPQVEAVAWFAAAYLAAVLPGPGQNFAPRTAAVVAGLALLAWLAIRIGTAGRPAALAAALAAYFLIPAIGGVPRPADLRTPDLEQLVTWARAATPRDAVFHFADAGKSLEPGIFRAEALRAVYVDWKGGGQVNYLPEFAGQWWFRWQAANRNRFTPRDLPKFEAMGIQYVVLSPAHRLPDRLAMFESPKYVVYALR